VVLAALAALAAAQQSGHYVKGQDAAILSEARYQSGDGKFGSAYAQEDGTEFKEETDADGTRRGSYSYIDSDGKRRTVSYTAGKNKIEPNNDLQTIFLMSCGFLLLQIKWTNFILPWK